MIYVGIDYHKKYSQVEAMDKEGKTLARTKLLNDEQTLKRYFSSLPEPCEVVIEACRNWQLMLSSFLLIRQNPKILCEHFCIQFNKFSMFCGNMEKSPTLPHSHRTDDDVIVYVFILPAPSRSFLPVLISVLTL